jgi:hypothetical protein
MSVISGVELENVINLFQTRGVKFYHACQYKDFKTYLQLGGVPSRNIMKSSGLPYTVFDTDETDQKNEVWNKVFGNLSDFGFRFAQSKSNNNTAPTPNPYGPILLIFYPDVFREASDIAICLRSAGGRNFNRDRESLSSVDEVNRIFEYTVENAPNEKAKSYIKFSPSLRQEFNDNNAMSPEVSCTVSDEILSFNYLNSIIVDSYEINGITLIRKVKEVIRNCEINCQIWERRYSEGRKEIKTQIANLLLHNPNPMNLSDIINSTETSELLKSLAIRWREGTVEWQYKRYAKYLLSGTLLEMYSE